MFNITSKKEEKTVGHSRGVGYGPYTPISPAQNVFGKYRKVNARGTLTLAVQPTNGDTFTIGSKTYTYQSTLTNFDGNIQIGGSLAETQRNTVNAINLTGLPGTHYASATRVNTQVSMYDFVANVAVVKATEPGVGGNSIATTETFTSGSNVFDAATLGTYLAGADYTYPDLSFYPKGIYMEASGEAGTGQRVDAPLYVQISDYGQYQNPLIKWKWVSNAFSKIHIPNWFSTKVRTVSTIGFALASQFAQELSTSTGHSANDIRKIIEVGTNKGVAMYLNGTDSKIYVVAFTIDANTGLITAGTPVQVSNSTNNGEDLNDICAIGTDKFIVGFSDSTATNFPKCAVGTISGTTITMTGGVQPVATATTIVRIIQLGTDKALLIFNADSMYVVTVAVTTPSFGPLSTLTSATGITAIQNGTDKFQLAYTFNSANYTMACTVSGSTITQGTALRVTNANQAAGAFRRHAIVQLSADKIVYITDSAESLRNVNETAYYMTVSGTVTTIVDSVYKGWNEDSDVQAVLVSANRVMFVQNYAQVGFLNVDTTNGIITAENTQLGNNNHFMRGDNNIGSAFAFIGEGSVRFGKVGSFILGMCRLPSFGYKIGYYSFPISLNVDVYKDDDYLSTVEFKYPLCYFPVNFNIEIDDYEVNLKLKNPKAQTMYLVPFRDAHQSAMILE